MEKQRLDIPDDAYDLREVEAGTVLRDFHQDGMRCLVMRGPGALTAYIGIPLSHPLAGQPYDNLNMDVHGGLTFSNKGDGELRPADMWWYGWDYGHCDDVSFYDYDRQSFHNSGHSWTVGEVTKELKSATWDMKHLMDLAESIATKAMGWKTDSK